MSKGGLWQGARTEDGGRHQALHDSGSRPASASVAWRRRAGRKGQKAPREPCNFLLLPFPRILAPLSPWQCHSWTTAHHGDAPVWGHRCGTAPREGGRGQPALPKAGEGCQPQPRRDGEGSWVPCCGHQSSFSKVSSGMSVRKGRSQKRVLMPKPVGRGERPVSPWCCCPQDAAGDRSQLALH